MIPPELITLFSPSCRIENQFLLVPPDQFYKLERLLIKDTHLFVLICAGDMEIELNGKVQKVVSHSFLDIWETSSVKFVRSSHDLRAWVMCVTFEFASESLKNLRPGPLAYALNRTDKPTWHFPTEEITRLEEQLKLLNKLLGNTKHYYRQELSSCYFKSFNLELGNSMFSLLGNKKDEPAYISKRDFITLNFMRLVSKHFAEEHHVDFYAHALCISTKHLTRVIKEMIGKTPHEVICDEIIHFSMTQLEDDRIPVAHIAEHLHFSDQAAFCKFFKKYKKIPPMAYRRKIKTDAIA